MSGFRQAGVSASYLEIESSNGHLATCVDAAAWGLALKHFLDAIGDVTGEPMLAHRAMAQGELTAEIVAGHHRIWDRRAVPAVCFTDPEIVSVGLSPDQAKAAGIEVNVAQFPFAANGRAMTLEDESGFVCVLGHAATHEVLGI